MLETPGGAGGAEPVGRVLRVRLSANPDAPRLHVVQQRVWRHRGPQGPFFEAVAQALTGARLRAVAPIGGDRLVRLEFATPAGARDLVLELAGRQANLVLCDAAGRVLALLAPVPPRAGAEPRLAVGREWSPPGGGARAPREPGPPLSEALAAPGPPPSGPWSERAPLSWRVEAVLGAEAERLFEERAARDLAQRAERRLERARALVAGLEQRAAACADLERVRKDGELLKANLARVRRGMQAIEVDDWFAEGAPARRIALDPKSTPQANLERHFERYRKLERSRGEVERELGLARARVVALEELLARARSSTARAADESLDELAQRAVERGLLDPPQPPSDPKKRKPAAPRLPYRSFVAADGTEIRVGRSARDNDELTLRHSRGSDLWLHTADCPGSHVVVRLARGAEPDPETLLDAATLAAHFSPARQAGRVPVHVARRSQVHKPRGAKPGLVTLSGGRILEVRVQQARLERLLRGPTGRAGDPGPPSG